MACPNRVVSWANTVCVHWTGHDALGSALINDVATPPIVMSWIDIISLTFSFNHDHVISILNFPVNHLCYDSIGNKLFGFVFSRSDEAIVIGVCGMRSADQDHRIESEPIASGSFLESGPEARKVVPCLETQGRSQGTTLSAYDLHNARATILNTFYNIGYEIIKKVTK